jgi:molybdopterin-synthase adenylyltransferase
LIENTKETLRALPVQAIELEEGVLLKRGCTEFTIHGPYSKQVVQTLLSLVSGEGATYDAIYEFFPSPYRPAIEALIQQLIDRRILVAADVDERVNEVPEDALEVFYWHFGYRTEEVARRLDTQHITIMGVNYISRQLIAALNSASVRDIKVVDYPLLRNVRLFNVSDNTVSQQWPSAHLPVNYDEWVDGQDGKPASCLVATSDFGGMHLMREWNQYCVDKKLPFLPVVLQNLVGYIGPLVVPHETSCFECLRARQNSHIESPNIERAAEYEAFQGQLVNGFHPSMASVLGDIAAIELTKFYGRVPQWRVGTLIEVNLLQPLLVTHKVLKVPRCSVCSTLNTRSSVTLNDVAYSPPDFDAPVE